MFRYSADYRQAIRISEAYIRYAGSGSRLVHFSLSITLSSYPQRQSPWGPSRQKVSDRGSRTLCKSNSGRGGDRTFLFSFSLLNLLLLRAPHGYIRMAGYFPVLILLSHLHCVDDMSQLKVLRCMRILIPTQRHIKFF